MACLNIAITMTATIKWAAQNNVVLSPQTTEEKKTTIMAWTLRRRRMQGRVWWVY